MELSEETEEAGVICFTKAAEKSAKESPADVPGWDPAELSWDRPLPSLPAVALL